MQYSCVAPCHFALEAVLKRELTDMNFEIVRTEDGRISFTADEEGIARANIGLRSAERILLQAGRFKAETFDELFENTKALPWENFLTKDARFWVKKASSVKSRLFSPSDIQSIVKKAIVERLKEKYHIEWFPETGASFPIRVFIYKDEAIISLDTSGDSLHKRGYRKISGAAPISETLAAAIIKLTPWKADRILIDPFCGSGTFAIEAAMMAKGIAPGLNRGFRAEEWTSLIPGQIWENARSEARDLIKADVHTDIQAYDIDGEVLKVARYSANEAGVGDLIHFQRRDVKELSHSKPYGFIITNPPYGERLTADLAPLYETFGKSFAGLNKWSASFITSYEDAQRYFEEGMKGSGSIPEGSGKAPKKRKIYNGMIKATLYQYMGEKPPKN